MGRTVRLSQAKRLKNGPTCATGEYLHSNRKEPIFVNAPKLPYDPISALLETIADFERKITSSVVICWAFLVLAETGFVHGQYFGPSVGNNIPVRRTLRGHRRKGWDGIQVVRFAFVVTLRNIDQLETADNSAYVRRRRRRRGRRRWTLGHQMSSDAVYIRSLYLAVAMGKDDKKLGNSYF